MKRPLEDLLSTKGPAVHAIAPDSTLHDAAVKLCEHRIGALVVLDAGSQLVGILSERDIMQHVAARKDLDASRVQDAMTREVIVGVASDDVGYTMNVMTRHRIRHLPVMQEDRVVGVISIGDIVKALREEEQQETRFLEDYVQGKYW